MTQKSRALNFFLAASIIPAIIVSVFTKASDNTFCAWIMLLCAVTAVFPLSFMAKSGDFTFLAGYDKNAGYNISELKKMLYSICTHISADTLVFITLVAFCGIAGYEKLVTVVIVLAYALDFTAVIIIISKKYEKTICIKRPDKDKDKKFNAVAIPFIILVVLQTVVLVMRPAVIGSNALTLTIFFIAFCAETIWFIYEIMRKERKENSVDYTPRKKLMIAVICIEIVCTVIMAIGG